MIDFEIAPLTKELVKKTHDFGANFTRKIARYYDEYEHEHDELTEDEIQQIRHHYLEMMGMTKETDKPGEKRSLSGVIMGGRKILGRPGRPFRRHQAGAWECSDYGGGHG